MATRQNTIIVPFDARTTQLAAATRNDFTQITISIPENVSRTFRSVTMFVFAHDNISVAASMSSWLLGIKLGAAAFTDVTQTLTLSNSGDNGSYIFTSDITSYFTTNFGSGASQTCQIGVQFGAVATLPICGLIRITYDYDDTELRDSGTATAGGATTLTDSGKGWTTNAFESSYVKITGGTGSGQVKRIVSNTGTVLTVDSAWSVNPSADSTYQVLLGRAMTVWYLLESRTAQDTNTLTEIGTNQVPALDTILANMANIDYRFKWFETAYNNGGNATTDFNLALSLDAEAEVSRGVLDMALNSADYGLDIWVRNDMTTNAAHAFKSRSNNTTNRFSLVSPILYVTFNYNHADSTRITNSLRIPLDFGPGLVGVSGQPRRAVITLNIQEPGTITLVQSGVQLFGYDTASFSLNVLAGTQSVRTYAHTAGSVQVGPTVCNHRIDSGGAQGAAFTLARGLNTLVVEAYASSGGTGWQVGGWLYLNYTSDKHSLGVGAHKHSVYRDLMNMNNALATFRQSSSVAIAAIPESEWYMDSVGFEVTGQLITDITTPYTLSADILSGEFSDNGRAQIGNWQHRTDGELQPVVLVADPTKCFQRYSSDPDTNRLKVEDSRVYQIDGTNSDLAFGTWVTYHAITYTVSGNVRGYTGDGSGHTVALYRASDHALLLTTTTAAGGTFSFTWFDDVAAVYCTVEQDGNRAGRSKSAAPGTGFDIYISPLLVHPGMAGGMRG